MIEKSLKKAIIEFPLLILFTILMVFSGCARNFPSDKLSSAETTEKQVKQLINKSQMQLDHFSNVCIPAVGQCLEKKQKILHMLSVIESTAGKINLDTSSMEMDDFLYTVSYLQDEIEHLGDESTSIIETTDKIEDLKNQLQELSASIDEIFLAAENERERENTKFSLKKKIMNYKIKNEIGKHAKNDFGL